MRLTNVAVKLAGPCSLPRAETLSTQKMDDSSTSVAVGGALGVHAFLNRFVSLDPELTVLYSSGSGTLQSGPDGGLKVTRAW